MTRVVFVMIVLLAGVARAAEPVQPFAVKKTATGGATVLLDGKPIAEYIVDRANKPFLWGIIGPTGKPMMRAFPLAEVPGETSDHVHQRGLTFGHQGVGGFDTWAEAATYRDKPAFAEQLAKLGAIRHQGYRTLAGGTTAVIHASNEICDAHNKPLLAEERRMTFSAAPAARIIDVDIDLVAAHGPVELADMKDAGVYIRVPDSMAVDRKQGGAIVNSAGQRDAEAWSKPATWVDYHGPVDGEHLGIAILNHPSSFRHPTPWHVRTYGLFCANPFGLQQMNPAAESGAVSLAAGERISLRHRFVFHVGDEREAGIAAAYEAYAAEPLPPLGAD
ncbi:MAG: PmoA family protein [Planctomycetia bacterium]